MAVRFQRHLGAVESLDPGQFTVRTASGRPALCCHLCGAIYDLPETHRYDHDGRVVPALRCPTETCSFFDYVCLESVAEAVVL